MDIIQDFRHGRSVKNFLRLEAKMLQMADVQGRSRRNGTGTNFISKSIAAGKNHVETWYVVKGCAVPASCIGRQPGLFYLKNVETGQAAIIRVAPLLPPLINSPWRQCESRALSSKWRCWACSPDRPRDRKGQASPVKVMINQSQDQTSVLLKKQLDTILRGCRF